MSLSLISTGTTSTLLMPFFLASMIAIPEEVQVRPIEVRQKDQAAYCYRIDISAEEADGS